MSDRARLVLLLVLLTAGGLAAGCATVPSGGRVVAGRAADPAAQVDDPYVRIIPVPPQDGWSPKEIIQGFLAASASFDDQHAVAARYLATGVAWHPDPQPAVIVYDDSARPRIEQPRTTDSTATVTLQAPKIGVIGPDGQYTAEPDNLNEPFHLAKNSRGQWRITRLPPDLNNGLLLGQRDVTRAFRTRNLYFFALDGKVLVPNPIFLPLVERSELPSQLVNAELNGATLWLTGAVTTSFPAGSRLIGGRVGMSADGVVTVNLSKQAAVGNVQGMAAQLMWTLKQLPEVKGITLQIEGATKATGSKDDWRPNDPDAGADDLHVAYLRDDNGKLLQLPAGVTGSKAGSPLAGTRLFSPAVSLDRRQVAGMSSQDGGVLQVGQLSSAGSIHTVLRVSHPGARFIQPSWDRHGNLWVVESSPAGSWLWIIRPGAAPAPIGTWELSGSQVLALRVARDGVRVAAIVVSGKSHQIQIGRIADRPGGITTVDGFLPISADLSADDLAWSSANELAVLARGGTSIQAVPYQVPVSGGLPTPIGIGSLGIIRTITAAPGSPVLIGALVTGPDNKASQVVCRLSDPRVPYSDWYCSALGSPTGAADPAYPG